MKYFWIYNIEIINNNNISIKIILKNYYVYIWIDFEIIYNN